MRKARSPRDRNLSVKLTAEELGHVVRWADADPLERGMGHVLRRLIAEEVERERQREDSRTRNKLRAGFGRD